MGGKVGISVWGEGVSRGCIGFIITILPYLKADKLSDDITSPVPDYLKEVFVDNSALKVLVWFCHRLMMDFKPDLRGPFSVYSAVFEKSPTYVDHSEDPTLAGVEEVISKSKDYLGLGLQPQELREIALGVKKRLAGKIASRAYENLLVITHMCSQC
jgi:hypothetical protein